MGIGYLNGVRVKILRNENNSVWVRRPDDSLVSVPLANLERILWVRRKRV